MSRSPVLYENCLYFLLSVLCRASVNIKLFFVVSDLLTVCQDKLLNIGKGKGEKERCISQNHFDQR